MKQLKYLWKQFQEGMIGSEEEEVALPNIPVQTIGLQTAKYLMGFVNVIILLVRAILLQQCYIKTTLQHYNNMTISTTTC